MNDLFNYKVLYVEDDSLVNETITNKLKQYFKYVYSSTSAEEAYTLYLENKFDIIFTDIHLHEKTGIDLLEKIRQRDHTIKAVILTASDDLEIVLKATSLKLTKYLIKPIRRKDLEECIFLLIDEMKKYKVINEDILYFQDEFSWNKIKKELLYKNEKVSLTPSEYKIFQVFIENLNRVLSYEDISMEIWNDSLEDKKETLKTTIKNLRKKLPKDLIQNEYALGYKLIY